MALRDRMKENWKELTLQEKKAGEFYHEAIGCQSDAALGDGFLEGHHKSSIPD